MSAADLSYFGPPDGGQRCVGENNKYIVEIRMVGSELNRFSNNILAYLSISVGGLNFTGIREFIRVSTIL